MFPEFLTWLTRVQKYTKKQIKLVHLDSQGLATYFQDNCKFFQCICNLMHMFPDQIGPPWHVGVKLHIFNAVARLFNTLARIFQRSCSFNGKLLSLQHETRPSGFPYIFSTQLQGFSTHLQEFFNALAALMESYCPYSKKRGPLTFHTYFQRSCKVFQRTCRNFSTLLQLEWKATVLTARNEASGFPYIMVCCPIKSHTNLSTRPLMP
jgi:hypothetical protein